MLRVTLSLFIIICTQVSIKAQRLVSRSEAFELAISNQRNLRPGNLNVVQQEQVLKGSSGFSNPQLQVQASPYEPMVIGVQQSFSLPAVYQNRKELQNERIKFAKLQLAGSQLDLKRAVNTSYFQLQYFTARIKLLTYQDSVYTAIKVAAKRFFDAGQINKLEELQAVSQADRIHNEVVRALTELQSEKQVFSFYTNMNDSFNLEPIDIYPYTALNDTLPNTIQKQLLAQQVAINRRELQLQKAGNLPSITAGLLFPTTKIYERAIGYQVGVGIPIWTRQNKSRIAAAQTGIDISIAQQELANQQLNTDYRQAIYTYRKEQQSLAYFNEIALPQARAIIETSQRLFQGGELNYIESLRNLQMAFQILNDHLETHRALNQSVIELNYLEQTL